MTMINLKRPDQIIDTNSRKLEYRCELDGLRAIAVLAVIFYHAQFKLFKGGFVGVDVFFVLSDFLMTSIILNENTNDTFLILKFYERRIRRILPMLLFTIAVSYLPAYHLMPAKEFFYFTKSAFLASIGLSNTLFATTTLGYFETKPSSSPLFTRGL
jgi:peptidoglycan/LPS O-acetylase OafA/YrhL